MTPASVTTVGHADFSPATYEATVESLRAGVRTLSGQLTELPRAASQAVGHAWVPGWLADAVRSCTDRLVALGRDLAARVGELLTGYLLTYDALTMKFRKVKLPRDPHCAICGDHPTITELIDYEQPACDLRKH